MISFQDLVIEALLIRRTRPIQILPYQREKIGYSHWSRLREGGSSPKKWPSKGVCFFFNI